MEEPRSEKTGAKVIGVLGRLARFIMWLVIWSVGTVTVLTAAIAAYIFLFVSNFDGYCEERGRVTTDRELIVAAIEHELEMIQKPDGGVYANAEEFLKENPKCCKLRRESKSESQSSFNRFIGSYIVTIYINNTNYKKYPEKRTDIISFINSCGELREQFFDVY